jgi:hypothetical protein
VEWNHPEPANQSIINQVKALVRSLSMKLSALFCLCVCVCLCACENNTRLFQVRKWHEFSTCCFGGPRGGGPPLAGRAGPRRQPGPPEAGRAGPRPGGRGPPRRAGPKRATARPCRRSWMDRDLTLKISLFATTRTNKCGFLAVESTP